MHIHTAMRSSMYEHESFSVLHVESRFDEMVWHFVPASVCLSVTFVYYFENSKRLKLKRQVASLFHCIA